MQAFKIVPEGDGFYTVKDVPIFETHDTRGFECNEEWMRECIQNFEKDKAAGHRPAIIIGHNVKGVEKENEGFLDNFKLVGKRLFADMCRVTRDLKDKIVKNKYPSRSVEVLPNSKRILALALLGGTTPYFALPQMVYENQEESLWYRSPLMFKPGNGNVNGDLDKAIANALKTALPEALQTYQQQQEDESSPTVFNLNIQQAVQYMQENPEAQLFQAEDGNFYAQGSEGEYYQIPEQVAKYADFGGMARKAGAAIAGGARRAGSAAKSAAAAVKGKAVSAGRAAGDFAMGQAISHPRRTAAVAAGAALGTAAAGGAAGGYMVGKRRGGDRYQLDENTGVVYFNGVPVGEVAMYNDTMGPGDQFPPQDTNDPILEVNPAATAPGSNEVGGLTNDPGEPEGPYINHTARGDSDQFSLGGGSVEAAEMYQLKQEVDQLKYANELLQLSRKADNIRQYLLSQKQAGAPVGDIDTQCDFMITLDDNQLKTYKATLESAPKVALGSMDKEGSVNGTHYSLDEAKVKSEFAANAQTYGKLGVTEQDLKYAGYVRTNRMVGERN